MAAITEPVVSSSQGHSATEEPMLGEDVVRELLGRLARGEGVKTVARARGRWGWTARRSSTSAGWAVGGGRGADAGEGSIPFGPS